MRAIVFKTLIVTTVACGMSAALQAADGVLIVSKTTIGTTVRTSQLQIERSRMRTEMNDPSGASQTVVFDGTKHVMYMINGERKTYSELTQADVDRLGGQMQDAMAQMNAAMANMTPAQRAQMDAMMASAGRGIAAMAGTPATTVYKKTGTDRVGRWTCDKYEGYQGTTKTNEVCTVNPSALGFSDADFAVTREMAEFFSKLIPQGAAQLIRLGRMEEQGYAGFPVRQVSISGGQTTTVELSEVSKQTFPDSTFAVPADYQKVDFMGGPGRGRGRGRGGD